MANTAANVVAGKPLATGGILSAPVGTALPTNTTTAPNAGFVPLGYIGEDGVTESGERTTEKIRAWGGDTVKVVQTEHSLTYTFTFYETLNADVLAEVNGAANVTTTAATASSGTLHAVKVTGEQLPHREYIFEIKDGDARIRICLPDGQITEVGEIVYSDGAVIGYPVTVEAFADAAGAKAYKYLNDGKTTS